MISAIIKGVYLYFLPLVILGIFLRLREKKWTKAETVLLLLFLGHLLLMLLQVFLSGGSYSRRYLLPGAPLLFGWAGYALYKLSFIPKFHWIIIACLLFLFQDAMRPALEHLWKEGKKEELFLVREFSPVIRKDWQGRPVLYKPVIQWYEYHSPKAPLVLCRRCPYLGYAAGGSGILVDTPALPLPDYRIFENRMVEPPYVEIHQACFSGKIYRVGKRTK